MEQTHTICLVEDIEYFPELMQLVQEQVGTEHPVEIIDCCNQKGVLVALHRSDVPRLDEHPLVYHLGAAFNIAPFNLRWADPTTRLIFRKWLQ